jgi:hypothetical protein
MRSPEKSPTKNVTMSTDQTYEEAHGIPEATGDSSSAPCSPPDWDAIKWRQLLYGETIQKGDWVDAAPDGWRDDPKWQPTEKRHIGKPAPDPRYPAHRVYRRPVYFKEENA